MSFEEMEIFDIETPKQNPVKRPKSPRGKAKRVRLRGRVQPKSKRPVKAK